MELREEWICLQRWADIVYVIFAAFQYYVSGCGFGKMDADVARIDVAWAWKRGRVSEARREGVQ